MLLSSYSHTAFQEEFKTSTSADDQMPGVKQIKSFCTNYAADLIVEQRDYGFVANVTVSGSSDVNFFCVGL